jgi:hypothetical protein
MSGIRTDDPRIQETKTHSLDRAATEIDINKIQEQKNYKTVRPIVYVDKYFHVDITLLANSVADQFIETNCLLTWVVFQLPYCGRCRT